MFSLAPRGARILYLTRRPIKRIVSLMGKTRFVYSEPDRAVYSYVENGDGSYRVIRALQHDLSVSDAVAEWGTVRFSRKSFA